MLCSKQVSLPQVKHSLFVHDIPFYDLADLVWQLAFFCRRQYYKKLLFCISIYYAMYLLIVLCRSLDNQHCDSAQNAADRENNPAFCPHVKPKTGSQKYRRCSHHDAYAPQSDFGSCFLVVPALIILSVITLKVIFLLLDSRI